MEQPNEQRRCGHAETSGESFRVTAVTNTLDAPRFSISAPAHGDSRSSDERKEVNLQ